MLIPALTDFKHYMNLLEGIMPASSAAIRKVITLVEADVGDAVKAEQAEAPAESDSILGLVATLKDAFSTAIVKIETKVANGVQKFQFAKRDFNNTLDSMADTVKNEGETTPFVNKYIAKLVDIRNGIYDPASTRYYVGNSKDIVTVHDCLVPVNDALANLQTYAKSIACTAKPSSPAVRKTQEAPVEPAVDSSNDHDSVDYWFNYLKHMSVEYELPMVLVKIKQSPELSESSMAKADRDFKKLFNQGIDEYGDGTELTIETSILDDGMYICVQLVHPDNTELIAQVAAIVDHMFVGPQYNGNVTIYKRTHGFSSLEILDTYKNGEYAVNYQWVKKAIGTPSSGSFETLGAFDGVEARHCDSIVTALAKVATGKINRIPMMLLSKLTTNDVKEWFPTGPEKISEFIAKNLSSKIRDYVGNISNAHDNAVNEADDYEKKKLKKNDFWSYRSGKGSTAMPVSDDFMDRF